MQELVVGAAEAGERVDRFVGKRLGASRRQVMRLIERGSVRIGGKRAKKGQRVAAGDRVVVAEAPPRPEELRPVPEAAPLEILHEQPDWVAIAKPPGPPSHPLETGERGTMANAIVARWPECADAGEDPREGGLVHRLDAGTSGVLVAARSREAWRRLRERFRAGEVDKEYLALVAGAPASDHGTIDAPLASRGRRAVVDPGGRPAQSDWSVAERLPGRTLLRVRTRTGRMHQVRAHLGYAELPIVGDVLYGGPEQPGMIGHFLHAERLTLEGVTVFAPLPADRTALLSALRNPEPPPNI